MMTFEFPFTGFNAKSLLNNIITLLTPQINQKYSIEWKK
jgi:hypothetical protein